MGKDGPGNIEALRVRMEAGTPVEVVDGQLIWPEDKIKGVRRVLDGDQVRKQTLIKETRWHALDEKETAAIDFLAERTRLRPERLTNEVDPMTGQRVPISKEAAIVFSASGLEEVGFITDLWDEKRTEGVMAYWGDWEIKGGITVFVAKEVTDVTTVEGPTSVSLDVAKIDRQMQRQGLKDNILLALEHIHPRGLGERLAGRFSDGDYPSVPSLSFRDRIGGAVQRILVGVVSHSGRSQDGSLAIGSYVWNQNKGQTRLSDGVITNGRVEKLEGYYVMAGDEMAWVELCNPGEEIAMKKIADYRDGKWKGVEVEKSR